MLGHMSTTRTATRLVVAASLLLALILSLAPVGAAAEEGEASRVAVSDLTLQRVDRTGAAVDGGLALWSHARLGFSWSGDPKPEPTPSVEPKKPEPTPSVEPKKPEPTPSVEAPTLARTGTAAGGGLALAAVMIVFGFIVLNNRNVL